MVKRPTSWRLRRLFTATLALAAMVGARPAYSQSHGEAHAVVVAGADDRFSYRGFAAGGGAVFGSWLGIEAQAGIVVDDSDERSAVLSLDGGLTMRLLPAARATPFVFVGASRRGDVAGPVIGGGLLYWIGDRAGLRVDGRAFFPASDNRPCRTSPRPPICDEATRGAFLQAGAAFRFGAR
jgi:hypothetical protein